MGDILGMLGGVLGSRPAAAAPRREAKKDRSQDGGDSWSQERGAKARKDDDKD